MAGPKWRKREKNRWAFGGNPDVSRRIYELSREVIAFQRATEPLGGVLGDMMRD